MHLATVAPPGPRGPQFEPSTERDTLQPRAPFMSLRDCAAAAPRCSFPDVDPALDNSICRPVRDVPRHRPRPSTICRGLAATPPAGTAVPTPPQQLGRARVLANTLMNTRDTTATISLMAPTGA